MGSRRWTKRVPPRGCAHSRLKLVRARGLEGRAPGSSRCQRGSADALERRAGAFSAAAALLVVVAEVEVFVVVEVVFLVVVVLVFFFFLFFFLFLVGVLFVDVFLFLVDFLRLGVGRLELFHLFFFYVFVVVFLLVVVVVDFVLILSGVVGRGRAALLASFAAAGAAGRV